jgi:hypothetical protein
MSLALGIDHLGIIGADLDKLAEVYEQLGFTLTPLFHQQGGLLGSRHIMLAEGYLELIAPAPDAQSQTLSAMLARHVGAHILALSVANAAAALTRLQHTKLDVPAVVEGVRGDVQFATLPLTNAPEGRLLLIQHKTPAALRPPRFLGHANHAVALHDVAIATTTPAETASRLSQLAGRPVEPDPLGGFALKLAEGGNRVRILPSAQVQTLFPGAVPPAHPWIAGATLSTDDRNAALRRRLAYWGISHIANDMGITVQAGGFFLNFTAA